MIKANENVNKSIERFDWYHRKILIIYELNFAVDVEKHTQRKQNKNQRTKQVYSADL